MTCIDGGSLQIAAVNAPKPRQRVQTLTNDLCALTRTGSANPAARASPWKYAIISCLYGTTSCNTGLFRALDSVAALTKWRP